MLNSKKGLCEFISEFINSSSLLDLKIFSNSSFEFSTNTFLIFHSISYFTNEAGSVRVLRFESLNVFPALSFSYTNWFRSAWIDELRALTLFRRGYRFYSLSFDDSLSAGFNHIYNE